MSVGRLCKLFGKSRQAYYQREAFYNEQYQVVKSNWNKLRKLDGICLDWDSFKMRVW
jgi:hypothetical protein